MTQKEFAKHLLVKVLNVSEKSLRFEEGEYCQNVHLFSDKHADGTKVLRIKMYNNPTNMSLEECDMMISNYLADVVGIKKAEVRKPYGGTDEKTYYVYSGLQFVIQVEYVGKLPDLDCPHLIEDESPTLESTPSEENTSPAKVIITELPNGMYKVETPFGVGYATDKEDLERMKFWLEGVQVGMGMTRKEPEDEDILTKDTFRDDLRCIEAENPAEWWSEVSRIMEEYSDFFESAELMPIAMECFGTLSF